MAELNFPQDRTELVPPGTGPLQTGDEYTANGTTWIYDSVAKAWGSGGSGDSLSDLYLSKVNDDTAAGLITFENGVSVTGGDVVQSAPSGSFTASSSDVNLGEVGYTGSQQRHNGRFVTYNNYVESSFGPWFEYYNTNGAVERQFAIGTEDQNIVIFTDGNNTVNDASTLPLTVSPPVTFNQETYHKGGVKIIGGAGLEVGNGFTGTAKVIITHTDGELVTQFGGSTDQNYYGAITAYGRDMGGLGKNCFSVNGSVSRWTNVGDGGNIAGHYSTLNTVDGIHSNVKVSGYYAASSGSSSFTNPNTYAYYSFLNKNNNQGGANNNWSYFSIGTAPSYLKGDLIVANDETRIPSGENTDAGTLIQSGSSIGKIVVNMSGSGASINHCLILRRTNSSSSAGWQVLKTGNYNNTATGFLKCDGGSARTIDARLGATGVAMADGAADIVKLLQPKVITQGGHTFNGFLPADLIGTFAAAVDGEAGATVAIGTYTDAEGAVQTDVEEPEAIPFGATWNQTGTRDLMQGVSRGELIPLLTKALQEALDKIETLETRLNDAGIA